VPKTDATNTNTKSIVSQTNGSCGQTLKIDLILDYVCLFHLAACLAPSKFPRFCLGLFSIPRPLSQVFPHSRDGFLCEIKRSRANTNEQNKQPALAKTWCALGCASPQVPLPTSTTSPLMVRTKKNRTLAWRLPGLPVQSRMHIIMYIMYMTYFIIM